MCSQNKSPGIYEVSFLWLCWFPTKTLSLWHLPNIWRAQLSSLQSKRNSACVLHTEYGNTNISCLIWQSLKDSSMISLSSFSFRLVSPLRLIIVINILVCLITLWKPVLNRVGWALYLVPWKIQTLCTRTPAVAVAVSLWTRRPWLHQCLQAWLAGNPGWVFLCPG